MSYHPAGGVGLDPSVPAPPPGPGAAPPFAAPPTDRSRRSLWVGLGVGGALLLLCCVGGIFGLGVLVVGSTEQAKRQAAEVVTDYLTAMRNGDAGTAHSLYCDALAARVSRDQLAAEARSWPYERFALGEPRLADRIELTAQLFGRNGRADSRTFTLDADGTELCIIGIR